MYKIVYNWVLTFPTSDQLSILQLLFISLKSALLENKMVKSRLKNVYKHTDRIIQKVIVQQQSYLILKHALLPATCGCYRYPLIGRHDSSVCTFQWTILPLSRLLDEITKIDCYCNKVISFHIVAFISDDIMCIHNYMHKNFIFRYM